MSLLKPFTHEFKERAMSLPHHRVTIISRSMFAVKDAVQFLRSAEESESRHRSKEIFKNKYTELVEQKRGEWPTQATLQSETPALVEKTPTLAPTLLDGEVEIDTHLLDHMVHELATEGTPQNPTSEVKGATVIDLTKVRQVVGTAATPAAEAQRHLVEVTRPEGATHDLSEAA